MYCSYAACGEAHVGGLETTRPCALCVCCVRVYVIMQWSGELVTLRVQYGSQYET